MIELLIVVVILGVLATVTLVAVRGITQSAETSVCRSDQSSVQTAVEAYFTLHDRQYPPGGEDGAFLQVLHSEGLLREEPHTPEEWFVLSDGEVTVDPSCEDV
jgi:type II secretory pathway pseudopilin PulG